jgi:cytosine/adenosine deaminase-related metal-dependent hydrolase
MSKQKVSGKERRKRAAARSKVSASHAPASMTKLTSGTWQRASEVKTLRLPSGS